jgi:hypothetical protein
MLVIQHHNTRLIQQHTNAQQNTNARQHITRTYSLICLLLYPTLQSGKRTVLTAFFTFSKNKRQPLFDPIFWGWGVGALGNLKRFERGTERDVDFSTNQHCKLDSVIHFIIIYSLAIWNCADSGHRSELT